MDEARPEIVIHMAAQSLVRRSYVEPVDTYATNVMGTVHVLEAVRQSSGVQAVAVVTSAKCYANVSHVHGYTEDEPLGGADPYNTSQASAEPATPPYRPRFFDG